MSNRYKIAEGSQSWHCCFQYTVVDTDKPQMIGGKVYINNDGEIEYDPVCECFEKEDAVLIVNALNKASE